MLDGNYLVELEIYTRVKARKTEFGGSQRSMYRIAFFDGKFRFVWINKDRYNTLVTSINKNGELFKRYAGPAIYDKGTLYIGVTPELVNGSDVVRPLEKKRAMTKVDN